MVVAKFYVGESCHGSGD